MDFPGLLTSPFPDGRIHSFSFSQEAAMLREFEGIAMRGNVMGFAQAAIIGGLFGAIIASLVKDVLRPLIGIVPRAISAN
jgi:hypothetical protein